MRATGGNKNVSPAARILLQLQFIITMYKGYELYHCWCGYPQKRWLILLAGKWKHTARSLKKAKKWINEQLQAA